MTKEDILKNSRSDFEGKDPYELKISNTSYRFGHLIMLLVCCIFMFYEILKNHNIDIRFMLLVLIGEAAASILKYVYVKNKKNKIAVIRNSILPLLLIIVAVIQHI